MLSYFLNPGYIFFTSEPGTILTVVGSGVAISIYDPKRGVGGMNHFVHPQLETSDTPTALYAKPATLQLVRMFRDSGSDMTQLEAQVFGGACPPDCEPEKAHIGESNLASAREWLMHYGVKVVGQDTGGTWGRKVAFKSDTGEVMVAKVNKIREDDWFPGLNRRQDV